LFCFCFVFLFCFCLSSIERVGERVVVVSVSLALVRFHASQAVFDLLWRKDAAQIGFGDKVLVASKSLERLLDGVGRIGAALDAFHIAGELVEGHFAVAITVDA